MAKLLHLRTSPMSDLSFSVRVARSFLAAYRAKNPGDSVETLDLATADLPAFDFTAASGKYKIMRGLGHSAEEATAWSRVIRAVGQLKAADKVVVSTGMWNFSIPYRLKQWLDLIVQPGLTFSFDPATGYTGLVTGRPVQLLLASGGNHAAGTPAAAYDHQKPYLELMFGFIGFTDVRTLVTSSRSTPSSCSPAAVVGVPPAPAARTSPAPRAFGERARS